MFLKYLIEDPIYFIQIVTIIITSIVIHELAHGFAALSQGDDTPRLAGHITINPVVHMGMESLLFLCVAGIAWGAMPIDPAQFRYPRWSDILVSAAGPCSNLLLGTMCIVIEIVGQKTSNLWGEQFLALAAQINMMLFIFNLLPIPPLDGFHVCSGIFPGLKKWEGSSIALFGITILFLVPVTGELLSVGARLMVGEISRILTMLF
jgi:Zn-dependent protease